MLERSAALELAQKTRVAELPAFRQATFYTDIARSLATDRRTHDRAVQALLSAERAAPQQVRSSPLARETARDLRDTARRLAGRPGAARPVRAFRSARELGSPDDG